MTHSGSCLCGAVTYEVDGDFDAFYLCHCGRCRKDTGSAHAANLFSSSASLRWLTGEDRVTRFHLEGTLHARAFCSLCGSAVPQLQSDGSLLVVPAGSLDTSAPIAPDAHLFTADRASWDAGLERLRAFDGLPK